MSTGTEIVAPGAVFRSITPPEHVHGLVNLQGQEFYCIPDYDRMPPFLMTVVSDTDLWMYLSSTGALTAGRVNEDRAIFPYETDDRLHCQRECTGPLTLLRVRRGQSQATVWHPFSSHRPSSSVRRNLYKSVNGQCVLFEEINEKLGLTFRYTWSASDALGFVRRCVLINLRSEPVQIDVLDGLCNVLPAGADLRLQQRSSCLINAYTRCEVDPETMLGIFAMTSLISDRAEPAESLHANVVWCHGLSSPRVLLCGDQIDTYCDNGTVRPEALLKGRRGSYLACGHKRLESEQRAEWYIAADAHRDQATIVHLRQILLDRPGLQSRIDREIKSAQENLLGLLASADALQATADPMATHHHFSNVLFNCMRGGILLDNGRIGRSDLESLICHRNRPVHAAHQRFLSSLPERIDADDLLAKARKQASPDLLRLCLEYLPLTFSRRHGDPSRPWNRFSIRVRNEDGTPALNYQGNWRDIFQNWEALSASFPQYLPHFIAKFLNASTVDGFNPYRVTRGGFEWEVPDPEDPWSNIGYWGDHQIIYLLKFLESYHNHAPGQLGELLCEPLFAYADVPYRLKPYQQILVDRSSTVEYDTAAAKRIEQRVRTLGADGKLLSNPDGTINHVTLLEKLLVSALSKLSNLVVDGGIWMNTQRPEWNDANNALVGNGLSMVTLCYLRRYTEFCLNLLLEAGDAKAHVSLEVIEWFDRVANVLHDNVDVLSEPQVSDQDRMRLLSELGQAFGDYRSKVYDRGFSGAQPLSARAAAGMFRTTLRYLNHSITANRRPDGLYHSYNLMRPSADQSALALERLDEMLEGQVAVLSSGALPARQTLEVVEALFSSRLYRDDQLSFMLYPDRELPGFLDKNRIDPALVADNPLLLALLSAGDSSVIVEDDSESLRFSAALRNARDLQKALDRLQAMERWTHLVQKHRAALAAIYETVFHHRAFTGRSSAMFAYEGLGCIYWHMVSKLLLAVQECHAAASREGADAAVMTALATRYYQIRGGLGFNKTPREYGAFPLDPYSHSPRHAGAQQPGMTGQVKEEILARWGELGIEMQAGELRFVPRLLRQSEFVTCECEWVYYDIDRRTQRIVLVPGSLAFTFCQVPIVYRLSSDRSMRIIVHKRAPEQTLEISGNRLDMHTTRELSMRCGQIQQLEIWVPQGELVN